MRKLIAVAAIAACAGVAQAGDGYGVQSWTGFHAGAHAGYGWAEWNGPLSYDDHDPNGALVFDGSDKSIEGDNWLGGLQVGVNYQTGAWVLGVEADVSWTDINGSGSFLPYPDNPGSPAWAIESNLDLFGTLRGRLGYASGPLLAYTTAGLAWGTTSSSIEPIYDFGSNGHATSDQTHVGYAVGGGLEWMLARSWSLKAEYLFVDLGEQDYAYVGKTKAGAPYDTDHYHADLTLHTVRLGLNYQFGK